MTTQTASQHNNTKQENSSDENHIKFSKFKLALLTFAISLVTFMEVLDSTIVNVSIPHIAGSLGATVTQGTWTISLYALASAIMVPLTSWISKTFGYIRVFLTSILLFVILSVLCGLSTSINELIVFRFFQGFFSGPMVPLSQTILFIIYPPDKRGLAMAFFVVTIIVAPILGPVLGGYITDTYSWPWIFFINLPVGIFTIIIISSLFKGKKEKIIKAPIDYMGIIFLFIGVGCLQLMLDNGNDYDWFNSKFIITLTIISIIGLTLFFIWELTDKNPAVDLTLFKNYNFTIGVIITCLTMFCFFGSVVVFPLWLQTIKGYTSFWSGLAVSPIGIMPLLLTPIIGIFINKLNLRVMLTIGLLIFSGTMFWYGNFIIETSFEKIVIPRIIQGIGIAFLFLPLNQITLSTIPKEKLVSASSLYNFSRTFTTSLATAIIIYLWQHWTIRNHANLAEHVTNYRSSTNDYLSLLGNLGLPDQASYTVINNLINAQAATLATEYIFNTMGVIFLFLTLVVWLAKPPFNYKSYD